MATTAAASATVISRRLRAPSTGAWTTIQAGGLSNATTSSVSIALVGIKAPSASELNVYFDNVMLKAKSP